ncbi:hypothetical protein [Tautonia rosea]|uniref:hypothetical protein n=1 Tax=Tautonia rosea TaxID=2728037 RepID=UPI0014747A5D|nr:hypothetical protein [Tautonia rosea]
MDRPLDIEGDFLLEFEGGQARLEIRDEVVDLHFPNAQSALAAMRQVSPSTRRNALRHADAQLRAVGLVGHVRVGGRSIAQLGGTVRAGLIARMLKVDPLALKLFSVLGAWLGRNRTADTPPGPDISLDRSSRTDGPDSSSDG